MLRLCIIKFERVRLCVHDTLSLSSLPLGVPPHTTAFGLWLAVLVINESLATATDFDSCSSAARNLRNAADEAASAQSSFESACGSYGYSRSPKATCGSYGYERSRLESALSVFEDARARAVRVCGFSLRSKTNALTALMLQQQRQIESIKGELKSCESTSHRPMQ